MKVNTYIVTASYSVKRAEDRTKTFLETYLVFAGTQQEASLKAKLAAIERGLTKICIDTVKPIKHPLIIKVFPAPPKWFLCKVVTIIEQIDGDKEKKKEVVFVNEKNEQEARHNVKDMLSTLHGSRLININEMSEITDVIE